MVNNRKEWFERRGELKKEFGAAKSRENPSEPRPQGRQGDGSDMVRQHQARPVLRPKGPGSQAVDRARHTEALRREDQVARQRVDDAKPQSAQRGAGEGSRNATEGYASQRRQVRDSFNQAAEQKPRTK